MSATAVVMYAQTNWRKIADGRTARAVRPEAFTDADYAFNQLLKN